MFHSCYVPVVSLCYDSRVVLSEYFSLVAIPYGSVTLPSMHFMAVQVVHFVI